MVQDANFKQKKISYTAMYLKGFLWENCSFPSCLFIPFKAIEPYLQWFQLIVRIEYRFHWMNVKMSTSQKRKAILVFTQVFEKE